MTIALLLALAAAATGAGALILQRTLQQQHVTAIERRASQCAAMITPAAGGDLSTAIESTISDGGDVRAIGLLDHSGTLMTLIPELPRFRTAVATTLGNPGHIVNTGARDPHDGRSLWGATMRVGRAKGDAARHIVLLLADNGYGGRLRTAVALLGVIHFGVAMIAAWRLRRWFDTNVTTSLQDLAIAAYVDHGQALSLRTAQAKVWRETNGIAVALQHLRQSLSASRGHKRRVEGAAEQKIRDERAGFDRRLEVARNEATIDPLTGLRNRKFLDVQLPELFNEYRKSGEELALVMLDVDDFKLHNDTFGHAAGDEVLRFVGQLLQSAVRRDDHAIRYGGDEFVLLLTGLTTEQATLVADRTIKLFRQHTATFDGGGRLAISAGIACIGHPDVQSYNDLLRLADRALYAAKRSGKNGVSIHSNSPRAIHTGSMTLPAG